LAGVLVTLLAESWDWSTIPHFPVPESSGAGEALLVFACREVVADESWASIEK
jgi:hypothetical protein